MNSLDIAGQKVALGFSGGPDAAALAYRLKHLGAEVVPVYVNYRQVPRGGKTAKDLRSAIPCAQSLGIPTPLELRVPLGQRPKSQRNRFFVKVLASVAQKEGGHIVALGTVKKDASTNEPLGRATINDLNPDILSRYGEKHSVQVLSWESCGVREKAEEFAGISPEAREFLFQTTSCQMWWRLECGNCHSCKERHAAFLHAFGFDRTLYRPNSKITR